MIHYWLERNTSRVFLNAEPQEYRPLELLVARNERFSFQFAFRHDEAAEVINVHAELELPEGWTGRIRRVGNVPVEHRNTLLWPAGELDFEKGGPIPGFVPDVLYEDLKMVAENDATYAYWITAKPAQDVKPGEYRIKVVLVYENNVFGPDKEVGRRMEAEALVRVSEVTLQPRRNFNITNWFYADCISDFYKVKPFSQEFWPIAEKYMRNYVEHGLDTLYVPTFTPPLDGVKNPTQLLNVTKLAEDQWKFDWADVDKWVGLAKNCGITNFEWVHPFTQWGVKFAIRIYEGQGEDRKLLWPVETPACSDLYRKFLTQYLEELHDFLQKHDILDKSYFHVSDEPSRPEHCENYRAARAMLKEIAPWMKTMDALSELKYGLEHITDMPVCSTQTAMEFVENNIECWCYYCCAPRAAYIQRLLDTPLPKIAMHGILFYRWPFKGFLHWGYNYWNDNHTSQLIDVFTRQDGTSWPLWCYGDPCMVYPGQDGPLDSIRWELFSESLQDYQLLQTLGVDPNGEELASIRDFADFPKDAQWRYDLRKKLLM